MPAKTSKPKKTEKETGGSSTSGGKAKKKKWSKGKVRDKLNNMVLFDKATYDKCVKDLPQYKLITPAVVCERFKVRGSLARSIIRELVKKGQIRQVVKHSKQEIYTRATKDDAAPEAETK
ncbi:unnamed protein product [Didymodactylos carnosus]|uniref:40S ribosomal protein S25 n=1 Tax=Didymodactylos carnosus TaxID=1234261 RepID=A0A813YDW3_9BILA|nr:unnamed protein product [Didymodactylos carnosus]CAF0971431.1 unnamed protein product [Didymodactylos carnosus]CAF3668702.1 unnamed protein product [Didymodactylos carnosus]CAF3742820.1 unnamed protein product [Didymodactylos carnosus]